MIETFDNTTSVESRLAEIEAKVSEIHATMTAIAEAIIPMLANLENSPVLKMLGM